MAAQYDGTILINTAIDTDGFVAGGKEIEAHMRKVAESVKGIGNSAKVSLKKTVESFVSQNQQFAAQKKKVEELKTELDQFGESKQFSEQKKKVEELRKELDQLSKKKVMTEDYSAALKYISELQVKLEKIKKAQEDFLNAGGKQSSSAYKRRANQIAELTQELKEAKDIESSMRKEGTAYQPSDTSAMQQKYEAESAKLQQMNTKLGLSYEALQKKYETESSKLQQMNTKLGLSYESLTAKIEEYNAKAGKSAGIKGKLAAGMGLLLAKIKGLIPGMNKMNSATNKSGLSLKKLLMYGFGIRSLFALFNRLRGSVVAGFQNLSQYSGQTNADISMLMSALTRLKNSLATAFAPILSVVAPILTKFINLLSTAATYVSQFMSALTGKSSYVKAVKVQQNYAAGLKSTGSAAKDAKKELEGYLSPIDEINKMEKKDTDTASGGGAGGGVDPSKMFETKPIESSVMSLAEKVKKAFAEMFAPLADAWKIYGPSIKESLGKIKQDFVDFFVEIGTVTVDWAKNRDWKPLLASVDNLLKKFEPFVDLLLGGFAWAYENILLPFGKWTIEEGLPAAINFLAQAFEFVTAALETLKPVAQWLWDNLLKDLAATVGEVVVGITDTFTGLLEFFTGVFSGDWEKAIHGLETMHDGLERAVMAVFNFIQNNIMVPFDTFLQKVFTVDFTKYFGVLGNVLNGFMVSASQIWDSVKEVFNGFLTFLKGVFSGNWRQAIQGIVQIFGGVFGAIEGLAKAPINAVIGLINGMIEAITSGMNWVVRQINKLSFDVPDWVPEIGGKSFGFNISEFGSHRIPYLATGAVIPANSPFMAMLGDQKHGNNIEAPESLIRRIVREESGGKGGSYRFTGMINRRVLFDEFIEEAKIRQDKTGMNPLTSF